MEEVKAGLQCHLSEGGVNSRLEAHIFILVWNNARGENVQTETLLRGLTNDLEATGSIPAMTFRRSLITI